MNNHIPTIRAILARRRKEGKIKRKFNNSILNGLEECAVKRVTFINDNNTEQEIMRECEMTFEEAAKLEPIIVD